MPQSVDATGAYTPMQSASELVDVLDNYLADLKAGRTPDRAHLLARHPELASQLESCLAALDFIHKAEQPNSAEAPAELGDFRIVREIGRGGMGVVFEAEQISLKRRVALKVLRFAAGDAEAMRRFQREAETVARLHHTNIVPIFAVGCERGTHYYAMQFIAGRSLADASKDLQMCDLREVARWGVQAAEALAYAHARGVIHRDVKPSNLLLDDEGTVWLTDFGLARCSDELTMTATGMLLGTPRYISPEQASVVSKPVDARSDVYSLGASLYELATGKPVYDGETLQRLLAQIRDSEPRSPRTHRPDLPGDLETILLKCLEKEPARRYASAQELADDLRRFAVGDPIKARRPGPIERAVRWWRKRKGSAVLAVAAATVAAFLVVAGWFTWQRYDKWRNGQLYLANEGAPTTAEVFRPDGTSVGPPFSLPTEVPIALPAGEYLLKMHGQGFIDETYRVRVDRGIERAFDVSLSDQRLWTPIVSPRCYELAEFDGRTDVFVMNGTGVSRRHGATGAVIWDADLRESADPKLTGFRWDWDSGATPTGRGDSDRRPRLQTPCADLNGDGIPDLVWVSSRQAAVLALSGSDGKVLWCYQFPPPPVPKNTRFHEERASIGAIIGLPIRCQTSTGSAFIVIGIHQTDENKTTPRWVAALSTVGKLLWRYDLPGDWFRETGNQAAPDSCLWSNMIGLSTGTSGGSHSGPDMLYEKDFETSYSGGLPAPYPAQLIRRADKSVIAVGAGTHLLVLEPDNGQPIGKPTALGFWPIRAPQFVDLDGDGNDDALLLGPGQMKTPANDNSVEFIPDGFQPPMVNRLEDDFRLKGPNKDDRLTLSAVTLADGRQLWRQELRGYWGWNWNQEPFEWPVVADIDGDGKPEIVVPTGEFTNTTKWAGVELREGSTGAVRWQQMIERSTRFGLLQQVNRIIVGPDIDGDGCRELFTAVLDGKDYALDKDYSSMYVGNLEKDFNNPVLRIDALSGKDGRNLWWSAHAVRYGRLTTFPHPYAGPMRWWNAGPDGWPLLMVPYLSGRSQFAYFASAGTGKLLHFSTDLPEPRLADLDGDGLADILAFRLDSKNAYDRGGIIETVRGCSPEIWRELGNPLKRVSDIDGDGIPDLIAAPKRENRRLDDDAKARRDAAARPKSPTAREYAEARSGRDGRLLWRTEITDGKSRSNWEKSPYEVLISANADLDGDGTPDLFATIAENTFYNDMTPFPPVVAISGRTGELIWVAGFSVRHCMGPQLLACHDLDGDGKPEVVAVFASDWDVPHNSTWNASAEKWQYWLAVLDGATGRVKWKQSLTDQNANVFLTPSRTPFSYAAIDLDGDGKLDLVVEGGLPDADGDVRAFRGTDGEPLWHWRPGPRIQGHGFEFFRPTITAGDLDGDGRPEVLVLHSITVDDPRPLFDNQVELLSLDGRTGDPRWSWRRTVDQEYNSAVKASIRARCTPLLVRLGNGKFGVCVWTDSYKEGSFVTVVDEAGHDVHRPVPFRLDEKDRRFQRERPKDHFSPFYSNLFRVWVADLDGDGADDLLFFQEDKFIAIRSDLKTILWSQPLPDAPCDLFEIRGSQPAVRLGGQVVGLDGKTGKTVWSCSGSGTPVVFLAASNASDMPRVVFDLGNDATACRRAMPVNLDEKQSGFVPYTAQTEDDPRIVRPLPWNAPPRRFPLLATSPIGILFSLAALTFVVIIVPCGLIRMARRWRSIRPILVAIIWLGLVGGGLVAWYWLELNNDAALKISKGGYRLFVWDIATRFAGIAVTGIPAFVFLTTVLSLLVQRRVLRLLVLLGIAAALAVAIGMELVSSGGLAEGQRYTTTGWWAIWPAGAYAVGLLLIIAWLGRAGWYRRTWRPFRKGASHVAVG